MDYYQDSVHFDSIVVIESLRSTDMRTGEWLYYRVIDSWAKRNAPFHTEFWFAKSRTEFLERLEDVADRLFRNGHAPILHIEAHGATAGLELGNGDVLEWEELRGRLTEMNQLCRINLLVVMAMCAGWHLSRVLKPMDRAPAWGIIGPMIENVRAGELREAMELFYNTLLGTMDTYKALSAMNGHSPYEKWSYRLETAEMMFCRVFHHYAKNLTSEEQLKARENEIVAEIVRRRDGDITAAVDARQRAHRMLRQHSEIFDHFRQAFFMLDLIPQNAQRFKLRYGDCAQLPSPAT